MNGNNHIILYYTRDYSYQSADDYVLYKRKQDWYMARSKTVVKKRQKVTPIDIWTFKR